MSASSDPYVVRSTKQLVAIASPGRDEIIDAAALLGPCTVAELARHLGRSRHSLYYHVRALRDSGLLIETRHSGEGKKTTARYDLPGRPLYVRYDLSSERTRKAVIQLARSRLRSATRGFVQACAADIAVTEGPRRNLWVARWKGWMSAQELEEANEHLWRLVELLRQGGGDPLEQRAPYELTFVLAPVVAKGAGKSSAKGGKKAATVRKRARRDASRGS